MSRQSTYAVTIIVDLGSLHDGDGDTDDNHCMTSSIRHTMCTMPTLISNQPKTTMTNEIDKPRVGPNELESAQP